MERIFLILASLRCALSLFEFRVAELKPHYQCKDKHGQENVRHHIHKLASEKTAIIAMIQVEFYVDDLKGYTAFGGSCAHNGISDPVVVFVDDSEFFVDRTTSGMRVGYHDMPFIAGGGKPDGGRNCVAEPSKHGQRGYAVAQLKHRASGTMFCVVSGTFPHCHGSWNSSFETDMKEACPDADSVLIIADTNAGCESEGPTASKHESMDEIAKKHSLSWHSCSDPALEAAPTCCHDLKHGHPEARYWYDRTALCGGRGIVKEFDVHQNWICNASQEHKYTTATVVLEEGDGFCEGEDGTRCSGHEIGQHVGVKHHMDCCVICQQEQDKGCSAWSWNSQTGICHTHSECTKVSDSLWTSSEEYHPHAPAGLCSSVQHVKCKGHEIGYFEDVKDHAECCLHCRLNRDCRAWTWDWKNKHCHIHSSCQKVVNLQCHSGGIIDSPTPAPTPHHQLGKTADDTDSVFEMYGNASEAEVVV